MTAVYPSRIDGEWIDVIRALDKIADGTATTVMVEYPNATDD